MRFALWPDANEVSSNHPGSDQGENAASLNLESQFSAIVATVPHLLIDWRNLQHLIRVPPEHRQQLSVGRRLLAQPFRPIRFI
jgi:hypothetical protein